MEKMLIGAYIKQQREDRGWTQDFLCEGICSRTTLSRIENDTQAPSFAVLKKLFEKMCLPSKQFLMLTSKDNIVAENLQKKIKNNGVLFQEVDGEERSRIQAQILKDLDKLESLCGEDDPFIRQFILSAQVSIGRPERPYSSEERLDMLMEAMRLTIPRFDLKKISEFRYTVMEVTLINKIARTYSRSGDRKKAIGISRQLLKYIEENNQTLDEYPRQFCLVAHNHAIDLALEKKYEESIRYAERCRDVGNANGYRGFLPGCMAIMGECWFFLGDLKNSADCYMQAFYLYKAYGNKADLAIVRQEIKERLGLEMPD
jgi:transcriptional regulator with XRE-family HTH domain